jgi:hypothetical protein
VTTQAVPTHTPGPRSFILTVFIYLHGRIVKIVKENVAHCKQNQTPLPSPPSQTSPRWQNWIWDGLTKAFHSNSASLYNRPKNSVLDSKLYRCWQRGTARQKSSCGDFFCNFLPYFNLNLGNWNRLCCKKFVFNACPRKGTFSPDIGLCFRA